MARAFVADGSLTQLELKLLTLDRLPEVLVLDRLCFGGLWTESAYQREIDSPNSVLLVLEGSPNSSAKTPQDAHLPGSSATAPHPCPQVTGIIGVGCVWFVLEEAHITILGIAPSYRAQGLGTLMLLALLKSAVQRGSEWATLEVRKSNAIAQALYHRVGFAIIGQRKRYYPDTKEDALIFGHRGLQESSFVDKLSHLEQKAYRRIQASGWTLQSIFPLCTE